MCGRFSLRFTAKQLADIFSLEEPEDWTPRFNIAPSQIVLGVTAEPRTNKLKWVKFHWGFVPSWVNPNTKPKPMINARAETAHFKPYFKNAFQKRRCLIPADGFFEWKKNVGKAFWFSRNDEQIFAFAGLWEGLFNVNQKNDGTCVILTISANQAVKPIHDRMPVILEKEYWLEWLLSKDPTPEHYESLFSRFEAEKMALRRVSSLVNSSRTDCPDCVAPIS
ncbi:SOS response-associated peptidase [bacterium]|nr:SOS response-associated peptidase [bacterium]